MAQFDVHLNLGRSRADFPYLVILQSGLLREWDRRIVAPIVPSLPREPVVAMSPRVIVDGRAGYLLCREVTNVPRTALGPVVANLDAWGDAIIAAVDLVFSRAYPA